MPDDWDEDVLELRGLPRRRVILAGVVLAAIAIFAVVRLISSGSGRPSAAATPTGTPHPSTPVSSSVVAAPTTLTYSPVATLTDPRSTACPPATRCEVWTGVPVDVDAAVTAVFPGAIVQSAITELANTPGHFEPDLMARKLEIEWGNDRITIELIKPGAPTGAAPAPQPSEPSARYHVSGFDITVFADDSADGRLGRQLALDSRLLATQ